jgi:hypothetical protein
VELEHQDVRYEERARTLAGSGTQIYSAIAAKLAQIGMRLAAEGKLGTPKADSIRERVTR